MVCLWRWSRIQRLWGSAELSFIMYTLWQFTKKEFIAFYLQTSSAPFLRLLTNEIMQIWQIMQIRVMQFKIMESMTQPMDTNDRLFEIKYHEWFA